MIILVAGRFVLLSELAIKSVFVFVMRDMDMEIGMLMLCKNCCRKISLGAFL